MPVVNSSGRRLHIRSYRFTSPRQRSSHRPHARDDRYSGSSARHGSPANLDLARDARAGAQVLHRSPSVMSGDTCRVILLDGGRVPREGCVEPWSRDRCHKGRGRQDGSAVSSPVDRRPTFHATRGIRRRPSILRTSSDPQICRQSPLIDWPQLERSAVGRPRATRGRWDSLAYRPRQSRDGRGVGSVLVSQIFFRIRSQFVESPI